MRSDRLAQESFRNHQRQDLRLLYELRQNAGRESGAGTPGWAPFRASSDLQLVPIRQLALFKEMQGVKGNKGLNEQDKLAKLAPFRRNWMTGPPEQRVKRDEFGE